MCERVAHAWSKKGQAGVQPITKFLSEETLKALQDPHALLLPKEKMPVNSLRSRVRATDDEWFKIVNHAWRLGMMKPVADADVPKDKGGHLITNGVAAVFKEKTIDGKRVACQRFISIMCPINAVTEVITGAQGSLPYIGQLTGLLVEDGDTLVLDSEDLQSAFNLFSLPDQWLPFMSYSKKVCGSAMGLPANTHVRPALSVVPMGWRSAVGLVQEAVRFLVFSLAKILKALSVEKAKPIPDSRSYAVVYLDNFDEIEVLRSVDAGISGDEGQMTDHHKRFIQVCEEAGLPRSESKQLIHAFTGALQGAELDGKRGILKLAPDKLRNYLRVSLALLARKSWNEFHLRHWTGNSAFMATFRRSLFAGLAKVLSKGRNSSVRLNRLLRRVNAVILCADCLPIHLWAISKWNYADKPSRRLWK